MGILATDRLLNTIYVERCAIWYHLYNLKNAKNIQGALLKVTLLHGCFSQFLKCKNAIKSCKASHINCFISSQSNQNIPIK